MYSIIIIETDDSGELAMDAMEALQFHPEAVLVGHDALAAITAVELLKQAGYAVKVDRLLETACSCSS